MLCETEDISMVGITFNSFNNRNIPSIIWNFRNSNDQTESSHFVFLFSYLEQRIDEIICLLYLKNIDFGDHC
jgi:hypothetical protein